jgi:ATP-dependent DNA helicase RecG
MFIEQRKRFFPLPDYNLSELNGVILQIYGQVIDENYSKLLIARKDLPLNKVILLDRVQKKLPITNEDSSSLKKDQLIGGRKPNFYVESGIAGATDNKASYIKNRAFDDDHYKKMILAFIKQYSYASRKEIEDLLLDKLSNILSQKQKLSKVGNLLTALKKENKIKNSGTYKKPVWVLLNSMH